jgi:hypothetical protein
MRQPDICVSQTRLFVSWTQLNGPEGRLSTAEPVAIAVLLVPVAVGANAAAPYTVVLNWQAALRK